MIKEEEKKKKQQIEEKRFKLLENLYLYAKAPTLKSLKESVST